MQTYRRFVSYVYQYENGKKAGNRGFIKVEAKGSTCNIQISLKGICKDENTACSVYGFKREDGLLKGSLLAECPVKAGVVQEHLVLSRNEMGRAKYGLQELSGIIFQGNDRTMYGTQWDDDPMKMENFQPDEKNEEFTDSGSRFVEEEVEDQQSGNETPAGEWLIDGERMQEEIIPDRTGMQDVSEEMPVQTEPEDGMNGGTELQGVEQNVPEAVLQDEPGVQNQSETALPEETIPEGLELQNMPGETEPEETIPEGLGIQNMPGETEPEETISEGLGMQNMPGETEPEEAIPEGLELQNMPGETEPEETISEGLGIQNMPGETEPEEAIPEGLQNMPAETEPKDTRQGGVEQQNMQEEAELEEVVPDRIEMPEMSGVMPEDTFTDGRIYDQEEPEVELTKVLDTTIPVQELPEMDAPLLQAAENAAKRYDQGNYIKQEPKNFCPFSDGVLEDCRKIKISDLRFLDSRDQNLRNNRFVQHGYQMFGHLLLARIARNGQYILGVPGMYQQQEKFMADMFGFHNFKYAKRNGSKPSSFGYWYRLIYPPKQGRGNGRTK